MKKLYFPFLVLFIIFKTHAQLSVVSYDATFYEAPLSATNGIYFSSNTENGVEPHFCDGNSVIILKDIFTGTESSNASAFIEFQNNVYFSARDNSSNQEIWATNGTPQTTMLFKDLTNNIAGSYPQDFIVLGNDLIFTAAQYGVPNYELFISDGTQAGTELLKEIQASSSYGSNPQYKTLFNGKVYFSASDGGGGTNHGFELWSTDGTTSGTTLVHDINSSSSYFSSYPSSFCENDGLLYFFAQEGSGRELWRTDGTSSGTQLALDLRPGSIGCVPSQTDVEIVSFQNKLYFAASADSQTTQLWEFDPSTNTAQSITSGFYSFNISPDPHDFWVFNGALYFSAKNSVAGGELFKLDGSTSQITTFDINPGGSYSNAKVVAIMNNKLYFTANSDGINGNEIWVTDGTIGGTQMVADVTPGSSSNPHFFTVFNNELYFTTDSAIYKFNDSVLGLDTVENKPSINLYPNPSNSSFKLNGIETIDSLEIFDLTGKSVKQYDTLQDSYDISELKAGVYFISINTDNTSQTIKLIKN